MIMRRSINPLNTQLNPICHLLALLGAHHILHFNRVRVKDGRGEEWYKNGRLSGKSTEWLWVYT